MKEKPEISREDIDKFYGQLDKDARAGGYFLNPDIEFTRSLARGLLVNKGRYGYQACPCRLASGVKAEDIDINCPCDYRDADVTEYGACYCGLYVSEAIVKGSKEISSIPERRPPPDKRKKPETKTANLSALPVPVWRCKVCGYLCARDNPPEICPICKAKKERFERFL